MPSTDDAHTIHSEFRSLSWTTWNEWSLISPVEPDVIHAQPTLRALDIHSGYALVDEKQCPDMVERLILGYTIRQNLLVVNRTAKQILLQHKRSTDLTDYESVCQLVSVAAACTALTSPAANWPKCS